MSCRSSESRMDALWSNGASTTTLPSQSRFEANLSTNRGLLSANLNVQCTNPVTAPGLVALGEWLTVLRQRKRRSEGASSSVGARSGNGLPINRLSRT